MKIYIDLVLFLNFAMDFILLLSVALILRRNVSINRLLIGAFIGSLSTLLLFIKMNSFTLFEFKLLISIAMVVVTFSYKNVKYFFKNFLFLYLSSIILGGFLYFLNISFSYKQKGLVFFHEGLGINFIFLIIFSPIIIYIYIKECKNLKNNYNNYYKITIYYKNQIKKINAFLDTGNKLVDPYNKSPIILLNNKILKDTNKYIYVPYSSVNNEGMLKCIKVSKVYIEGIGEKKNVLVGLTNSFKIDDVDCILNLKLLEMMR